jgi:hypothetical protein
MVVIYNKNTQVSATQQIYRAGSKYSLEIQQFESIGGKGTNLRVRDLFDLKDSRVVGTIDQVEKLPDPEWYGTWYLETVDGGYDRIGS